MGCNGILLMGICVEGMDRIAERDLGKPPDSIPAAIGTCNKYLLVQNSIKATESPRAFLHFTSIDKDIP